MDIKECYKAFGGDFEDVKNRLMTPERITKFVKKFPTDPNYDNLCKALEAGDAKEAFRAAHTLKGLCQNLSFTPLYKPSCDMADELRGGEMGNSKELLPPLSEAYVKIMDAIKELDP